MGTGLTEWYERANIAIRQLRRYNETSGTRKLPGQDAKSLQHSRAGIDAPKCKSLASTEEAINLVNQLQTYFRLQLSRVKWLPNDRTRKVSGGATKKLMRRRYKRRPVLAVIENPIKGGWFDSQSRGIRLVSTARWDEEFAPPPLRIYLMYLFACALATFVADLPKEQIASMSHRKLRGCIFDESSGRREFRLDLVAAHLCGECEGRLSEMGVSNDALDAVLNILVFVREFSIRRPRSTRSLIFVGHGRSDDWKRLDPFLTGLGLEIEEFNRDPSAGVSTTERLSDMLSKACFALIAMTAEDLHDDGKIHARENVVHEIGLFQGKLGFRKAIIVKRTDSEKFSNLDGLTYISYPKGGIERAFPEIIRTLIREGVLDSRVGNRFLQKRGRRLPS
jgi:Predicted nucleotide-binding protein containing TIR-like domain